MKKIIGMTLLALSFFTTVFSQTNVESKYLEAVDAYKAGQYEEAVSIIKEIKPRYRTIPPKVWYVEIMAKAQILKANPLNDFSLIENTRQLTNRYLIDNRSRVNDNYRSIEEVRSQLLGYPKDQTNFNYLKSKAEKEAAREKAHMQQVEADKKAAQIKAAEDEKKQFEIAKIQKEQERLRAEQKRVQAEKDRREQAEKERLTRIAEQKEAEETAKKNKIIQIEIEKQRLIDEKKDRKRLKSFVSLGYQGGEIAKYGVIFESGGKKVIGFRLSARSSMTPEQDILNGNSTPNKTEVEMGPNIKISRRFYLNFGAGYGFYNYNNSNDYAGTKSVQKTGYLVTSAGLMIRLSRVININAGASFMDIDKDFYKPEIVFGISFNLKKIK